MTALSIQPTFPIFTETDGQPLENGYIWIGTANLNPITNPIQVYWDAALTSPAAQPIRTNGGYPVNAGTPARLYVNANYSIQVQNKNGSTVYSALSATERYSDVVVTAINAENVIYDPPFVGGVQTNVEAKLAQTVSVKDFGAVGDGVADDRTAIQAAFDSGAKKVYFPTGSYYLGSTATAINFIDLSALGENLSIVTDGFVEFVVETTAQVQPNIFYLKDNSHFTSGPVRFKDLGYNPLVDWQGAWGFCLDNNAGNWGDIVIDAAYGNDMVGVVKVTAQTVDAANRIRGIKIGQLFSDNCYYGFNAQNSGDGVTINNLISYRNYRSYFIYGVTDHKVKVYSRNTRLTSGDVNISRSVGGLDTSGIFVKYANRDTTTPNVVCANVNHIDLLGGTISNVDLNIDVQSGVAYVPCKFVNYTGAGGPETNAPSLNYVQDITVSGSCDSNATLVDVVASYAARRRMTFNQGFDFLPNTTIYDKFQLNQQDTGGTPTWIASVANPTIGDGTLSYSIRIVEGVAFLTMKMVAGSTTTFGTGNWTFLGFGPNANETVLGTWLAKVGSNYFSGAARILGGTTEIKGYGYNNANEFFSGFPGSWASGDELTITIAYPIS